MKLRTKTLLYGAVPLLFFIDIFCFSFFEQHLVRTLLCLYSTQLLKPFALSRLSVVALGLIFEHFFIYGRILQALWYIFPVTILGLMVKKIFYPRNSQRYLLLALSIIAQTALIDPYFFQRWSSMAYTLGTIFVNMIIMILFP